MMRVSRVLPGGGIEVEGMAWSPFRREWVSRCG